MKVDSDVAILTGLFVVLIALSVIASLHSSEVGGGAAGEVALEPEQGPVTVIRVDAAGMAGKESGPGKPSSGGDTPAEVEEFLDLEDLDADELDQLDLEAYDVILPGGLVLARPGQELIPNPPSGLAGLVVSRQLGSALLRHRRRELVDDLVPR